MSIITNQYSGNLQALIVWATNPPERTNKNRQDSPPIPYRSWIEDQFPVDQQDLKYWTGKVKTDSPLDGSGEWVDGYPHVHTISVGHDPSAVTMMLYLVVPDAGGELAVGGNDENDPYELVTPTPGLAVFVDATQWHGVKPVTAGERIALIVSTCPAFLLDES